VVFGTGREVIGTGNHDLPVDNDDLVVHLAGIAIPPDIQPVLQERLILGALIGSDLAVVQHASHGQTSRSTLEDGIPEIIGSQGKEHEIDTFLRKKAVPSAVQVRQGQPPGSHRVHPGSPQRSARSGR
jgi:hypothetical protein